MDPTFDVADYLYEDALKICRREGHDLEASLGMDGESFTCRRCGTVWVEEIA